MYHTESSHFDISRHGATNAAKKSGFITEEEINFERRTHLRNTL